MNPRALGLGTRACPAPAADGVPKGTTLRSAGLFACLLLGIACGCSTVQEAPRPARADLRAAGPDGTGDAASRPLALYRAALFAEKATASEEGMRADAEALALRALYLEGEDLLLDEAGLAELTNELAGVLARLKSAYPEFASFRARRDQPVPGELQVRLRPEFARIVRDVLQDFPRVREGEGEGRPIALRTGHRLFDRLNEQLGLWKVDLYGPASAVFHLHERANVAAAAGAYSVLEVVQGAKPSKSHLDGSDITAYRAGDGEGWTIFIANRWGDCPSGCMEEERFRFEVEGETVELKSGPKSPTVHGRW